MTVDLPDGFATRIIDLHGVRGQEWLDALPALLASLEQRWSIRFDEPFHPLTYNFVAPATQKNGTRAVLKLGVPGLHTERETECLRRYDGFGAPYLFKQDLTLGAMLIERVKPGTDLTQLNESEAIEAAVGVMRQLHRAPAPGAMMPTVSDWGKGFRRFRELYGGNSGPLPALLVDEAESVYLELAGSMDSPVLLHGDLHHGNILAGGRLPWIAIDPQGVIGEVAYEVGAFLRNPMPDLLNRPGLDKILARRVAAFSDLLGLERRRIAGWGYAQAVLSGIWAVEDHGSGWEGAFEVANALRGAASL